MNKLWLTAALAIAGMMLGWQVGLHRNDVSLTPASQVSDNLPDTIWQNLDGGKNQLGDWRDKILIVNHWATWCEPCREEIPMFMSVQQQYAEQGVELIGIAHDNEEDVRRYVDSMGMDYPQLLAGNGAGQKWLAELGNNGSLPFTLLFDQQGNLRAKKLGRLSESELRKALESIL
jgi:thiol-disulfide isomerase/thioredoxin